MNARHRNCNSPYAHIRTQRVTVNRVPADVRKGDPTPSTLLRRRPPSPPHRFAGIGQDHAGSAIAHHFPDLTAEEALSPTRIHSVAGNFLFQLMQQRQRLFRIVVDDITEDQGVQGIVGGEFMVFAPKNNWIVSIALFKFHRGAVGTLLCGASVVFH